jgi:hypothetical protein
MFYYSNNIFVVRKDGNFVLAHINCNHLVPHINEMRVRFEDSRVDEVLMKSVSSRLWLLRVINLCVTTGLCRAGLALMAVGLVYTLGIVLGTK